VLLEIRVEVDDLVLRDLVVLEDGGDRLEGDVAALVALRDQPGDPLELEERRVVCRDVLRRRTLNQ